jgi:hypothetical protein
VSPLRAAAGLLLGFGLIAGLVALSHAPWRAHPEPDGLLRLSLSARPERIERCRTLSEADLAARPAHMRQPVVCEGTAARYRLEVRHNGAVILDREVTGGGARRDRPVHLLEEFPLSAGPHHLSFTLRRLDTPDPAGAGTVPRPRSTEVLPAELALDTTVTVAPHRVVLVTYDPRQQRLLALTAPRDP